MDYFKRLEELLQIEREEDRRSYQLLMERSSVKERRAAGLAWYPVAIRGSEIGRGEYLTVEVERVTHQDISHQLRFGSSASLFSNVDPANDRIDGIINWQSGDRLKITLRTDELPDWVEQGKLGVDLLFDENSYEEMRFALRQAAQVAEKNRLVQVLTGAKTPTFYKQEKLQIPDELNEAQQAAVLQILTAEDLAVVHGPPGTGKTTTLVAAIKTLLSEEPQQVLVTAPSNTAVDLLAEKLSLEGIKVLRVGNPARVSERLNSLTLDAAIVNHSSNKEIRKLKKQAAEYKNLAHKYKRQFGKAEREQRKALFQEAHRIMKDVEQMEDYVMQDALGKAQVIAATLVGANHYTVRDRKYRTVVIDEAAQALEPACWIPILKGEKVILAGDHFQLPPTIKSKEAAEAGLGNTLLEKVAALHPEAVTLLETQYRMHETIMGFSSREFYSNRLKAAASVASERLYPEAEPLNFIDTAGCGYEELVQGVNISNPEEAALLLRHCSNLVANIRERFTETFPSIAIISPYKQQVLRLKDLAEGDEMLKAYEGKIAVNTIDSFQGQERDVVYISLTRSNADGSIGFLSEIRRMNVAMTRAKKKLVVVGDSATLSQFPFYDDFIAYAQQVWGYQSAWEWME